MTFGFGFDSAACLEFTNKTDAVTAIISKTDSKIDGQSIMKKNNGLII